MRLTRHCTTCAAKSGVGAITTIGSLTNTNSHNNCTSFIMGIRLLYTLGSCIDGMSIRLFPLIEVRDEFAVDGSFDVGVEVDGDSSACGEWFSLSVRLGM